MRLYLPLIICCVLAVLSTSCKRSYSTAESPAPASGGTHTHEGAALYTCPMHPEYISDKPGSCPVCGMDLVPKEPDTAQEPENKKIMYRSTMHPDEVSDKPGKDSMGMEMVPFEQAGRDTGMETNIKLSAQKIKDIGVRSTVCEKRNVSRAVRATAVVAHDPELYNAQAEYLSAVSAYKKIENIAGPKELKTLLSVTAGIRTKLEIMGFGRQQAAELEKKGVPDETLLLKDSQKTVWVYAAIYENDLKDVKPGLKAVVHAQGASVSYSGKVSSVETVVNPETRSASARILITDDKDILRHNSYLSADIEIPMGEKLVIPQDAVLDTGSRKIVYIDNGGGSLEPRDIKTGGKTGDFVTVEAGIKEGEKVVINANFLIDSESRLKGIR